MEVAHFILKRLSEWGVNRIYGYPGDGINPILGAFEELGDEAPDFIQTRHEELAAWMACGHAKFTGEVGVCMATSGPGAIHLLNGLYDAKLDHQPVMAIVGQQPQSTLGGHYQQEVDLKSLFKDVAGEYVHQAGVPHNFPNMIDRAIRIAKAERTVTCVIVPVDVQEAEAMEQPPHAFKMVPGTVGYTQPEVVPPRRQVEEAAKVLNEGKKVAMLVGQGAAEATDEVIEAAELLGAGVAKALLGRTAVPDDLPFVTGPIGLLGSKPSYDMMMDCDTLFIVGSSFPYGQFLPEWDQAKCVQIDISAKMIGARYPTQVPLVGDAKETLKMLLPMLQRKEDRSWRQFIEEQVARWWEIVESRSMQDAKPINPQRVFWELNSRLPDNAIVTADSGSSANWWARQLRLRRGMKGSLSGTLASMGSAVPYAIAAKFAHPERAVIGFPGDGAFTMNGMNEMLTVARYWKRWSNPQLVFCVLNNSDLNQVTWEMRAMEGSPKWMESQALPDMNFAHYADLVGLRGIRVDNPNDVGPAWDEALSSDRPVVIDAVTDPEVPPLPPHVKPEQAKKFVKSVLSGDPEARRMVEMGWKQKLEEFINR